MSTNGTTWSPVSGNTLPNWTHVFNPTTAGAYTLRFRAVDAAGNVDSDAGLHRRRLRQLPPTTTVTTAPNTTFTNSIQIVGSAADTAPGVVVRVEVSTDNGATWATVSGNTSPGWTHIFNANVGGNYTLLFRAVDKAGNVDSKPPSLTVIHEPPDTTAPDTTVTTASGAHFRTVPFVVTGTAVDGQGAVDGVDVSIDGGSRGRRSRAASRRIGRTTSRRRRTARTRCASPRLTPRATSTRRRPSSTSSTTR